MQEIIEGFHLSPQQEHLWLLQCDNNVYRAYCSILLKGPLNIHALQVAIEAVIDQNEIYRTCLRRLPGAKIPLQVVVEKGLFTWQNIDLHLCHSQEQARQVKEISEQEKLRPIDCEHGPLFHFSLITLSSHKHILLAHTLALYADKRSFQLFMHKLAFFYCRDHTDEPLEDEIVQYVQFSEWQNSLLEEEIGVKGREWWRKKDLSMLSTSSLPGEHKPDETMPFLPGVLTFSLERSLQKKFDNAVEHYKTSVDSFLFVCWKILLWKLTGQKALCVGLGVDERVYEELAQTIGPLTKYIPLSYALDENQSFANILRQSGQTTEEAFEWQQSFLWKDVQHVGEMTLAEVAFFPVSFEFNELHVSCISNAVSFELQTIYTCQEPFKVKVSVIQKEHNLTIEFHYDMNLFWLDDIQRTAEQFQTLLEHVLSEPEAAIYTLGILSKRARDQVLLEFNNTQTETLPDKCMHLLFEEQVARTPDNVAVIDGKQQLSYMELNLRANQLAHYLQGLGVGPDVLVGVSLERSADLLVAILGILKAGGAYVPLDHLYPSERLSFIMAETQMPVLLTQQSLVKRFSSAVQIIAIDRDWPVITQCDQEEALDSCVTAANVAYVIYTSGSTGTPKGVMISHRGLVNYLTWCTEYYKVAEGCGSIVHSSIAFDLTITALFSPLLVGRSVLMVEEDQGVEALARILWKGNNFSLVKITPAHLGVLNTYLPANELAGKVRTMVIGGEALLGENLTPWRMNAPDTRLINEYGPTETVVGCCIYEVPVGQRIPGNIPIGRPIANVQLYILDEYLRPLPIGVPGEIYIGGSGLARGYYNRPELTAERFVPNPLSAQPGMRLYKTGDLASYLPNGTIEYLGRLDHQVKIRGYRIELEEIEAVLLLHPDVRECVVLAREDVPGDRQLVTYIGTDRRTKTFTGALRDYLREKLPEYMLPSLIVLLDVLPLTPNGKVDRQVLPVPELVEYRHNESMVAPRTPIEDMIAAIWEKVLRLEQVGIHENFFDIGGHSLLATQVGSRLRSVFHIDMGISSIFEAPTITALANKVEEALRSGLGLQMLPLVPIVHTQPLPLSFAQQRLWFLDQLVPNDFSYNIPSDGQLSGALNIEALERSLREVVRRHASLRTCFQVEEEQPVQIINDIDLYALTLTDLSVLDYRLRETERERLAKQEAECPFDLAHGPLLRTMLLRLEKDEHVLLHTMHHIISDGWSSSVLIREVTTLYNAFVENKPSPLPELSIQYADYSVWQRQWLQGEVLDTQIGYWLNQLQHIPPLNLPTDHPRSVRQTFQGAHQTLVLPPSLYEQLKVLSRSEGVTLFMLLLAAFQVLLARYSGQSDIAIGTPIANRTRSEIESLIGFFVNTLVLRTDLSGNPMFTELLQRVREVTLGAYTHQDIPFEKLVEVLQPQRDLTTSPFFQVMFIQQNELSNSVAFANVSVHMREHVSVTSKFDLTFTVQPQETDLLCRVEYSTNLFTHATMQRFLRHWHILLEGVVAQPTQRLADLPLFSALEQRQLLLDWNGPERPLLAGMTVHQAIEAQVERTPDAIAVCCDEQVLTYQSLNQYANCLATPLLAEGFAPETLVAVLAERSLLSLIALLAIWKAGGAYLPLDPLHPTARLRRVIEQSRCALVLTTVSCLPVLTQITEEGLANSQPKAITLEELLMQVSATPSPNPISFWQPEQLAYVIYTSGSTGLPKGVMVPQQGMLNHLLSKIADIGLSAADHVAQNGPLSFDIFVWQSVAALLLGGQIEIIPDEVAFHPARLLQMVEERSISQLQIVPALLRGVLQEVSTVTEVGQEHLGLQALRWLIPTGDALPTELCERWFEYYPHIPILNTYGSTECSDDQCHYTILSRAHLVSARDMPIASIGLPIANMRAYVLDEMLHLLPVGAVGELYIGGVGVGRGYLADPARTAQVFVPDPISGQAGTCLYKTGDMVRRLSTNHLSFLGRRDALVKVRGYRIELGEIEAVLAQHPIVQESVVLARKEEESVGKVLVAYVVSTGEITSPIEQLRTYLREKLPDYMVPAVWVVLEALPLNANGKVDRQALPWPPLASTSDSMNRSLAHTPIEIILLELWKEVLQRSELGIDEDFFALGGHSLLATQLISRIRALLQVEVPLRSVFEAPTIARLARQIDLRWRHEQGLLVPPPLGVMERPAQLPLSFAQQRLWFLDQLEPENAAYILYEGIRLQGQIVVEALQRSLQEIVRRHEILRTTFEERDKDVVQVIHEKKDFCFPVCDMRRLDQDEQKSTLQWLSQQAASVSFDLRRGPLLRGLLVRLSSQEHILLVSMHHIISDAWSVVILVRELTTLYRAFVTGKPSPLAPLPLQYADFALWQRAWLRNEVVDMHSNYWRKQLRGATPLELPTDRPKRAIASSRGAVHSFALSAQLTEALRALSRKEGATLFMTLLTAFQTLLHRYTKQQDIVVGTDVANRTHMELEGVIGFFVNLLVLRTNLVLQDTFRNVLKRVRTMLLNAYAHQDLPFEKLVEVLQPDRIGQQIPLVNTLFVMQNTPSSTLDLEGIAISSLDIENRAAKFNLAVFIVESEQGLIGAVDYRTDLFDSSSIAHLCDHFAVLLQSIVTSPDIAIKNLEMYTEEEKIQHANKKILRGEADRRELKLAKRSAIKRTGSDPSEAD